MDPITLLERQNFNQTGGEAAQSERPTSGWASLGETFAPGGLQARGEQAYETGMRVGAQTVNALAEARSRVNEAQAAETAASVIEKNPSMVGGSQDVANYLAARTRAGDKSENISGAALGFQKVAYEGQLARGAADPTLGAAFALDPSGAIPKAVGDAGSFTQPLNYNHNAAPGKLGSQFVNVSSQQSQMNEAAIQQKGASGTAALENAAAHQQSVNQQGTGTKIPAGYEIQLDANHNPVLDDNNQPKLVPRAGGPRDPNQQQVATGREMQMYSRVVAGAKQASTDMHNAALLPIGTTTGPLGIGSGPGHSLLQSATDDLRNRISSASTKQLTSAYTGLSRGLASIETSGLVPSGTFTTSFDSYAPRDGDDLGTILWKGAQMRQVVENGREVMASNPRVPPQMNKEMDRIVADVQKTYPYTPEDVQAFQKAPKGTTFQQFLASQKGGGGETQIHNDLQSAAQAEMARRGLK